jgi:hypothetical protein
MMPANRRSTAVINIVSCIGLLARSWVVATILALRFGMEGAGGEVPPVLVEGFLL